MLQLVHHFTKFPFVPVRNGTTPGGSCF